MREDKIKTASPPAGINSSDFYQETRIIESGKEERDLAFSRSDSFRVKNSHTHTNCLHNITFHKEPTYRVWVELFNREGGGCNYADKGSEILLLNNISEDEWKRLYNRGQVLVKNGEQLLDGEEVFIKLREKHGEK
jgi:hypothetical protein